MNDYWEWVERLANVVAIITGVLAAIFYFQFRLKKLRQQNALEDYLKKDKEHFLAAPKKDRSGKRSVVHLMARLKLTEDEVYQAAFSSNHIACTVFVDKMTRRATDVNFEYVNDAGKETMIVCEEKPAAADNPDRGTINTL